MTAKRNRGLTEQAANTAVDQACRMLRLPTIRAQYPELAEAAAHDQMTYRGFLAELLMSECDDRARRRSERRIKAAGFPRDKSLRLSGVAVKVPDKAAVQDVADASGTCQRVVRAPVVRSGR